jgi:glutamate 5-kinase
MPKKAMAARHHWIAFGAKPKGKIFVDEGARLALLKKKSLLSVGITALEGEFMAGDIVSIRTDKAEEFARGKTDISSKQLNNLKGNRFDKEIIHRDNIVIL